MKTLYIVPLDRKCRFNNIECYAESAPDSVFLPTSIFFRYVVLRSKPGKLGLKDGIEKVRKDVCWESDEDFASVVFCKPDYNKSMDLERLQRAIKDVFGVEKDFVSAFACDAHNPDNRDLPHNRRE